MRFSLSRFAMVCIMSVAISPLAVRAQGSRSAPRVLAASALHQGQTGNSGSASSRPQDASQSVLLKLFFASSRLRDLVGLVQAEHWNMTDAERSAFAQQTQSVENSLQALERWRYQLQYHPNDSDAAAKMLEAFQAVLPAVAAAAQTVNRFGSPTEAQQFQQAAADLSGLRDELKAYLQAQFPEKFPAAAPAASSAPNQAPSTAPAPPAAAAPPPSQASPSAAATPASTSGATQAPAPAPGQAPTKAPAQSENPSAAAAPPAANASAPSAAAPTPDQMRALLRGVYLTDARVSDLLGLLQPSKWDMPQSDRALFSERLQGVGNQLKTVEQWRYQLLYNLQKPELAQNTSTALDGLVDQITSIEAAVRQYAGARDANQFAQAAHQLADARNSVASYSAALVAENAKALAPPPAALPGGKTLTTERITVNPYAPPVSSLVIAAPPLTPSQVKAILANVYVSEFRIRDLLNQERPESWKSASTSARALAAEARTELLSRLADLEKWRSRFSENPGNMYDAFQTFRAVDALFHPLRVFGREAGKYESQEMAGDYSRREDDMEAQLNGLVPYIGFILQHADRNLTTFQTDLASCQYQLSYAMHGVERPARPMKNIVPVFQGRRVRRADRTRASHERAEAKGSAKSKKDKTGKR